MNTTLTVRNLDEAVKQKLRIQAAKHGQSMEAEARSILTRNLMEADSEELPARGKFDQLVGIWKGRMTTDEIMALTRGE